MNFKAAWTAARTRRWLKRCEQVGRDPRLTGRPTIHAGPGRLRIGDGFRLASRPVASHLVSGPGATLEIGDDVTIGCGAAIAAFEAVSIGDGTRIGPYVIIMDTNFHSSSGGQSLQHDCLPVVVGKGCRIGSRVTITRGVAIGDGAEILAGSVVTTSIPAGACAAGARARIIGRAGEIQSRWYGPAIALPEVLASPLGLGSPPDLDASEPARGYWSEARVRDVIAAVKARLAMDLDPALFGPATTLADIARAVQLASAKR